jgi:hypothetical protein
MPKNTFVNLAEKPEPRGLPVRHRVTLTCLVAQVVHCKTLTYKTEGQRISWKPLPSYGLHVLTIVLQPYC